MKKLWQLTGNMLFWCSWPVWRIYLHEGQKSRTRVLITCGDKALLVKNWMASGRWSLPGGGLHSGEDPKVGAAREINEELGLHINPEELRVLLPRAVAREDGLKFTFVCLMLELPQTSKVKSRWPEIADAKWTQREQIFAGAPPKSVLAQVADAWVKKASTSR